MGGGGISDLVYVGGGGITSRDYQSPTGYRELTRLDGWISMFTYGWVHMIQVIRAFVVDNKLRMSSKEVEQGHFSIYYLLSGPLYTCSWYARMYVSVPRQPDDKAKSIFSSTIDILLFFLEII